LKITYESMRNKVINVLQDENTIDIYGFNMITDTVDDTILNQNDISEIPFTYYEEANQSEIDILLENIKQKNNIRFMSTYPEQTTQNALRQLYSEYRVGLFLEQIKNNYDLAIIINSDLWIANNICIEHIDTCYRQNKIFISDVNPGYGLTNGFYFGNISMLILLLLRYQDIDKYFPCNYDYEYIVKQCILNNNIDYDLTNIVFFKIRANQIVHWQGFFRLHFLPEHEQKKIYREFYLLEQRGLILHYYAGLNPTILQTIANELH
jgi:hypothetical protein